jgi:hypothetical protein
LNALVATLVLFSTVVAAVGLGVLASGWVVNGILDAFGSRARQESTTMLIPSQTHASGD